MPEETKQCPYCAETIKAKALVCRFCGRDLPESSPSYLPSEPESLRSEEKPKKKKSRRLLIAILGGILLACCGLFALLSPSEDTPSSEIESTENVGQETSEDNNESISQVPTDTPQPTETPTPKLQVELVSATDYQSDGNLVIYGEVFNSGDLPAKEPDVRVTLYDEAGSVLVTESSFVDLPLALSLWFTGVLYPGEKAPFTILVNDPGEWTSYDIDLVYEEANRRDFEEHCREFLVSNDSGRAIDDLLYNYRVSGEIKNTGEKECGPVRFSVTLYDVQGNVVGVNTYMSDVDPFAPQEEYPFSVEIFARGDVDSYAILTRAIEK
ncbi:MAG: hypothetical protein H6655_24540 [Ardenticatenaceae bacterium]|nr:hypothetical protein [Ardenticatenaceae bacterium]